MDEGSAGFDPAPRQARVDRRRVLRDGAVVGGLAWAAPIVVSAPAAATTGSPPPGSTTTTVTTPPLEPGVHLSSACTEEQPYAIDLLLAGFVPDAQYRYRITVKGLGETFEDSFWFTTDAQGRASFPNAVPDATSTYQIDTLTLFYDPDRDDTANFWPGPEISFFTGYYEVRAPCSVPGADASSVRVE